MEKQNAVPQKIKNRTSIWSSVSTSGSIPKKTESGDSSSIIMFRSSAIHDRQKVEATQMSMDKWKNKMQYICMMEYYYALKRKELLITFYNMDAPWGHDAKWNKTQQDKCRITQLTVWASREVHKVSRVVKFTETDSGLLFATAWVKGGWGVSV